MLEHLGAAVVRVPLSRQMPVQGGEPLVDALATVELDLWAREQGLTKIRANVLGL